jgi:hypothetical protein
MDAAVSPRAVFVVTFVETDGTGGVQILGVYASEPDARRAINRASAHTAFAGKGDLFFVDHFELGRDDWPNWMIDSARASNDQ